MSFSLFRRGRRVAAGAALLLAVVAPPASGAVRSAAPETSPTAVAAHRNGQDTGVRTVTLITGDKVTVSATGNGPVTLTVRGPHGESVGAHIMRMGKDTYVYPTSVLPFVASRVLDERLFNVTELIDDGYDDATSDHLPLILSYTDEAFASGRRPALPGARTTMALTSVQGVALAQTHAHAADFWKTVSGAKPAADGARATSMSPVLSGGIAKIWLDGKAEAALSDTTAHIGAPQVWAGGDTGQGVDVAVLDTGIDADHPDFGGRVAATASFVPDEDVTDRHGHGTHVASTVAGTGAASGGKEKGVAPGASLHIAKVLDNTGSGQDSWILAGMEWAVRDQHAKIVSMSLGSGPTDGNDPMSLAVNRLSSETGALFVVAAGNSGPGPFSVESPGTADAALTVGAVDTSDRLASFSSRGPRLGDSATKPDLTAPGVDVSAARSQYAQEGEGPYLTMSGTSMATPHVAGAAALLAAAHPDWSGQQLKDALVSTTKTTQQYSPYAAGSGRLDVAAAVDSTVFATGSAFASSHWPYPPGQVIRKDVTYTNTGASPVTLDLSVRAPGVPPGLFTLTDSEVTVPAHGSSTVGVLTHLDTAADDAGYSAVLDASGPSGTLRTHTTIGASKESQRVTLAVGAKDRDGSGLPGILVLKDIARDTKPQVYEVDASGRLDLRVRPSTYAAWMYADIPGIEGPHSLGSAVLSMPELVADKDQTITFDADELRKVDSVTPQKTALSSVRMDQYRSYGTLVPFSDSYQVDPSHDSTWATPTPEVTKGSYTFATRWRRVQPPLSVSSGSTTYDDLRMQSFSPTLRQGTNSYRAVYAGNGSAADFAGAAVRGRVAVVRRNDAVSATDQAANAAKAGARLLLILNDGYGLLNAWYDLPEGPPLPVASIGTDQGQQLLARIRHGSAQLELTSHPHPEYLYDLARHSKGAIPHDLIHRPGPRQLARIEETFSDTHGGEAVENRFDLSPDLTWAVGADASPVASQGGTTTAWVTASRGIAWVGQAGVPDLTQVGPPTEYTGGRTTKETWFSGIQHPRLLSSTSLSAAPFRVGNIFSIQGMPGWGDSGGHAGTAWDDTVTTSIYQDDRLLAQGGEHLDASELASEALPYRLVVEGSRDSATRPYSTRTRTEWSFTSAYADDTTIRPLPLIQLDYGVLTDQTGKAQRRAEVSITPSHRAGARGAAVRGATLEVSYDDGATWRQVSLRHTKADWRGRLDAPSHSRYATLRTTARDAAGNSVRQTVVRAFGLK